MKRPVPLDAVEALRLYRAGPAAMFLPNTAQKSREISSRHCLTPKLAPSVVNPMALLLTTPLTSTCQSLQSTSVKKLEQESKLIILPVLKLKSPMPRSLLMKLRN
jgi:hypothetical protein